MWPFFDGFTLLRSRPLAAADPRILIGEATCAHAGDAFDTPAMGPLQLKGRSETLVAYRVIRRRTEESTA